VWPVSLDFQFFIAPSVFSNVYLHSSSFGNIFSHAKYQTLCLSIKALIGSHHNPQKTAHLGPKAWCLK